MRCGLLRMLESALDRNARKRYVSVPGSDWVQLRLTVSLRYLCVREPSCCRVEKHGQ